MHYLRSRTTPRGNAPGTNGEPAGPEIALSHASGPLARAYARVHSGLRNPWEAKHLGEVCRFSRVSKCGISRFYSHFRHNRLNMRAAQIAVYVRRDGVGRKYRFPAPLGTWVERSDRFCKVCTVYRPYVKGLNRAECTIYAPERPPAGTRRERTGNRLGRK